MALQPVQTSTPQYQFNPAPMSADDGRIYADLPLQDLLDKARKGDLDATQELQARTKEAITAKGDRMVDPNRAASPGPDMMDLVRSALSKMGRGIGDVGTEVKTRAQDAARDLGNIIRPAARNAWEGRVQPGMVVADDRTPGTIPATLPPEMMPDRPPAYSVPATMREGIVDRLGFPGPLYDRLTGGGQDVSAQGMPTPTPNASGGPQFPADGGTPFSGGIQDLLPKSGGSVPGSPASAGADAFFTQVMGDVGQGAGTTMGTPTFEMPALTPPGMAPTGVPDPVAAAAGAAPAADAKNPGRGFEYLMRMGAALMAAGEPQQGATRGPTLAGALGKAGLSTMDYVNQQQRADKVEKRLDEADKFRREQFDYTKSAAGAKAKREAYEFDTKMVNERMKTMAEIANNETNLEIKKLLTSAQVSDKAILRDIEKRKLTAEVGRLVNSVQQQGAREIENLTKSMPYLTANPAAQAKMVSDVRERVRQQVVSAYEDAGFDAPSFATKPSSGGGQGTRENPFPKDAFASGGKPPSGSFYISPKDGQLKQMP